MTRTLCIALLSGFLLSHGGCSSNEASVTTPDQEFYENLENTPIDSAEEDAAGIKPKG